MLKEFSAYLDPFEGLIQTLAAEQQEAMKSEFIAHLHRQTGAPGADTSAAAGTAAAAAAETLAGGVSLKNNNININRSFSSMDDRDAPPQPSTRAGINLPSVIRRRKSEDFAGISTASSEQQDAPRDALDPWFKDVFTENVGKIPLTFTTVETFLGTDPYRELRTTLDGYELLDIKGLLYWKDRLKKYSNKIDSLRQLISSQLDEKRNFMSFMLTIITTVLAPLTIFTGYFGMNFDNMI